DGHLQRESAADRAKVPSHSGLKAPFWWEPERRRFVPSECPAAATGIPAWHMAQAGPGQESVPLLEPVGLLVILRGPGQQGVLAAGHEVNELAVLGGPLAQALGLASLANILEQVECSCQLPAFVEQR